jgi:LPXTG-motif cell wall-anchored protein
MRKAGMSGLLALTMFVAMVSGATSASADPAGGGDAYAFGATVTLTDQALLEPTPEASASAPAFPAEDSQTLIPIPAEPLAVNGTLIASGSVHQNADLTSELEVEDQAVAGPYNARAVGQAEDVEVLIDAVATDVPLVEADVIRGEVVAKCTGDAIEYSASSEFANLVVAGDATLGGVVNDIVDELFPGLDPLDPLVNIEENVITELPDGLAVDALVVTVLEAADAEVGLVQARIGHAELTGVSCGALPQCSDTTDNDGDGVIDAADPGCHSDGDPNNPDTYDPNDDDETNGPSVSDETGAPSGSLPRTGASVPTAGAAGLGLAALALLALRRRTAL